ncbi:hypothetical protein ACQKOH_21225 [Sphingomonas sp. NPDC092331]|jgi:hypothetical protein|uniref:Uncharacterized protein n=3 Tax=Sphingomonadaceae TaxID=41297 RepID=T0HSR5_9SPHN|nr:MULTISPECIES: hypothetical protein [Sphingomonadaceae]KAK0350964.1 hypothetical protein LTR94_026890 [Friedmanniomyces endolithicus]MBN8846348.1 hypothetical protein [Sphingomonadales bacterium]PZU67426.1 MAG: hypothetical protein DI546_21750 [Rhizobium sp.]ALR23037.1 hypothetical protein ATN00_21290 [Sphingobium baderi]EQB16137.1 hypothetical protein L284_10060 [Novosphingobium lindaniclasticum LE124]
MQVTLFKALKSIKVGDDQATAVVEQLEEFMALKIKEANAALEAQNKALESKIDGLKTQLTILSIMLGVISLASLAGPILAKLIK